MIQDTAMRRAVVPGQAARFLHRDLNDRALSQPSERLFTPTELAVTREEAFAAGRAAGLAEASASQGATEAAALATIADALRDAGAEAARVADESAASLARALVAALSAAMPELVRRSALSEAGALLAMLMPGLSREPLVEVIVPSGLEPGIASLLDAMPPAPRSRTQVTGSGSLDAGEIRVVWEAGHAERRPGQIWQAVLAALAPALDDNSFGADND